ncbi:MAG: hypothetical protein IT483_11825 [Gammaproteobacteria bacterium]|nr:hypothetical protein [Gammaproteobacteria bacterium]
MTGQDAVAGGFVDVDGERYYVIRNVDQMPPFFVSVISSADHWLFVSSSGGLTAGRVSPETALFPYLPVDRIHECNPHTGCRTIVRVGLHGRHVIWEPFNREHDGRFATSRNLYKSVLGNKLRFEEVNHDLGLAFRYTWATSDRHGFVRLCELQNLGDDTLRLELVDGLQNILPAGTPLLVQTNSSNLVDAYKWTELDADTGLAMYALYSRISDRAEPSESLRANVVYGLGLDSPTLLLSSLQLNDFRLGKPVVQEDRKRGIRGAYFLGVSLVLPRRESQRWQIVADVGRTQGQVLDIIRQLADPAAAAEVVARSVDSGCDELARIIAAADGFQSAAEEPVTAHHYANVLFNVLRGGIFCDQYRVPAADFASSVRHFNAGVYERHGTLLAGLHATLTIADLLYAVRSTGDPQLERLCCEYLPITFGRRHGDPSRPWNMFAIRLKDARGEPLLSYEGNWRDIFQNWEALTFSYPEFIEYVVTKFVNASTVDGYNPYRITREGIDWEVEDPGNPWSHIGYWGDHQIVYLLKFLEHSRRFHPGRLRELLHHPIFSYANVPYRIRCFAEIVADPKRTVDYDSALAARIADRVEVMGADGKLVLDGDGEVYQVNLLEKLLLPLLAKLGNLVVDGGIWLNTQRPEWNDANNALVGHGVSMVTLYYMRRYVRFLQELLAEEPGPVALSAEVGEWLADTSAALAHIRPLLGNEPIGPDQRWHSMQELGLAASRYRHSVYRDQPFSGKVDRPLGQVMALLDDTLAAIDHSIRSNRCEDGTYNAYNLLDLKGGQVGVDPLYLMLEGQVAALSSGAIAPQEAAALAETLFGSDIYRADQRSFMLYADRPLPGFLEKNRIPPDAFEGLALLRRMIAAKDDRIVSQDADGGYRFNADFTNVGDLDARLDALSGLYGDDLEASRGPLRALYERVFRHREFTGRSGSMFGFEGLGCIYWHMVSKLLLAMQENFFAARDGNAGAEVCQRLGALYYRVREGIGFNKTPAEFGAFPTDPYSHTPGHGGAQQPGMTGQVKEEVLTRFGELGLRVADGEVRFEPGLLRAREFAPEPRPFRFLDVHGQWQELTVPASGLVFTWCQVPVVYRLCSEGRPTLEIALEDGIIQTLPQLSLPAQLSSELFRRSGCIRQISLDLPREALLGV